MLKIIEYCYKNKKVVSLYFNKEDNCVHLTGYICCYNEDEILISHITSRGEYDGFILNKIDNLYRIDYDGEYEKKIEKLYKLKKQSHPIITGDEDGILYPLLAFTDENQYFISVELQSDKVTGLINGYNDYIYLSTVNDFGHDSGITAVDIDEIAVFAVDTDNEQDLNILYKQKHTDSSV